nr:hypothetical protein [Streptomyces chryseus]
MIFSVSSRSRRAWAGSAVAPGVEGGAGDLEQFTRALDVVVALLLRLDERVHRHRVSFAKKAVARFEDVDVRAQAAVLPPRRGQLLALAAGQSVSLARVDLGLFDPVPHRSLGQIEVLGYLTDRAVTTPAQLDDLGLELRRERTTRARLLLPHALHDGHPPGGRTPDLECPSKRIKPKRRIAARPRSTQDSRHTPYPPTQPSPQQPELADQQVLPDPQCVPPCTAGVAAERGHRHLPPLCRTILTSSA